MGYSDGINELVAEGAKLYAAKEFDDASEKYAEACENFSNEHGEEDADLLLLYGKSLFQSAVLKSEVFGGTGGNEENDDENIEKEGEQEDDGNFQFCDDAPLAEEDDDEGGAAAAEEEEEEESGNEADKQDAGGEEEEDEEEQSDFEVAWEILDLTRSLFENKLEKVQSQGEKLKSPYLSRDNEETDNEFVILTKKLSETYDLLGEVSLEAENFPQSAIDLQNCLDLRLKLYNPENSSLISESHYKLSLALEFCVEDPELRSKACEQMRLAIESVRDRNNKEKDPSKKKDNDDLVQDLEVRYQELERDPADDLKNEQMNIIKGILGEPSNGGEDKSPVANLVNDLSSVVKKKPSKPAVNDLTSMVKKRKPTSKNGESSKKSKK
jgi:HAT1-interacting factor 1